MKILYISNEYPPETGFGGIGTYTRYMAEGMAARGHEVHAVCRSALWESSVSTERGVTIHREPAGTYPLPESRQWYHYRRLCRACVPNLLIRLAWARSAHKAFRALLEDGGGFDIVEYPECGAEGFYFRGEPAVGRVARLHTPWSMARELDKIHEPPADRLLQSLAERVAVRSARAVTSPTRALADLLRRRWSLADVTVIPNPIAARDQEQAVGGGWIYTGRIERRKGVHVLIEAYAALKLRRKRLPPLLLLGRPFGVFADGRAYADVVLALIARHNLGEDVKWVQGVEQKAVKSFLLSSSVAIFPSLWENFPYSCLEAMACGLAVVASNCGGYPEMLEHGVSGLLAEPDNPQSLAQALEQVLDNQELTGRLGTCARQRVLERFDTSVVCAAMESLFERVRAGRNA